MKIILNNIELTPINAIGGRKNVQGANRDTLTFVFPADMDMAELDKAFSAVNCESITVEGEHESYIHKGYTVRGELSKATVCVSPETDETPAVYEERIHVVMGQRTYAESQIASLTETVDVLVLESLL